MDYEDLIDAADQLKKERRENPDPRNAEPASDCWEADEWVCSHYQRKDFPNEFYKEVHEHLAICYVDQSGYWEMDQRDDAERWDPKYGEPGHYLEDPMSYEETEAMHDLLLRSEPMVWSERDRNGNLVWMRADGGRRAGQ